MARPKILFLAEKSMLDQNSGAALELVTWFEYLIEAGWDCFSYSMSCFDGEEEYPVSRLVSAEIDLSRDHGRDCTLNVNKIEHRLYLTKSTNTMKITSEELTEFHLRAKNLITEMKPDCVLCFGSPYMEGLIRFAGESGARTFFYLATSEYDQKDLAALKAADRIITPSKTLKNFYKNKLGLSRIQVVHISPNHDLRRQSNDLKDIARRRKSGFVTMINPAAAKGGIIFINVANRFQLIDPSLTFLAVESRGKREDWDMAGIETSAIKNLWWIPRQADIEHVFRKTSILLVPSVSFEAAGKVICEALVCGIPVIGSDRGGIKEVLNGSGRTIPMPKEVVDDPGHVPTELVDDWVDAIRDLIDDEGAYLESCYRSLKSGVVYKRENVAKEVRKLFEVA